MAGATVHRQVHQPLNRSDIPIATVGLDGEAVTVWVTNSKYVQIANVITEGLVCTRAEALDDKEPTLSSLQVERRLRLFVEVMDRRRHYRRNLLIPGVVIFILELRISKREYRYDRAEVFQG